MSIYFRQIRHLLPRARAWALTPGTQIRKFFEGLAEGVPQQSREFVDDVWADLWPDTTRELREWETQHGIQYPPSQEAERRQAIDAEWKSQGGQSADYIESVLHAAGFTSAFVHPSWRDGRTPYDLTTAVASISAPYDYTSSGAPDTARGVRFGQRGKKMVTVSVGGGGEINFFTLARAYDQTTATLDQSVDIGAQDSAPTDLWLREDGLRIYVVGSSGDSVYQYNLTSDLDPSTISYSGNSFSVNAEETAPAALWVSADESKALVVGSNSTTIYEYIMSTPGDASTGSYSGNSLSIGATDNLPAALDLNADESRLYLWGNQNDTVFEFALSTPGAITTATATGASLDISGNGSPQGGTLGGNGGLGVGYNNGTSLFVVTGNELIVRYSIADFEARDPTALLSNPLLGATQCGDTDALCGEPEAVCGQQVISDPDYLVNLTLTDRAPPLLPTDADTWPYFLYVGGETFGDSITIVNRRRSEFERLLLKLCPAQHWIGLFVSYAEALTTEAGEELTTESGETLTVES